MALVIAYSVVGLGVAMYVARMRIQQRRLQTSVDLLEEKLAARQPSAAKAA